MPRASRSVATALARFPEVWAMDFEFVARDGELPVPLCVTAFELHSGRRASAWVEPEPDQPLPNPAFAFAPGAALLAFFASAELGCMLSLGWPMPDYILDLHAEFRQYSNGLAGMPPFTSLVFALQHLGLPSIDAAHKDIMRALAMRGGPFSPNERNALLRYCWGDTLALPGLASRLLPLLWCDKDAAPHAIEHSLIRGAYMLAVAHMERAGVPIDTETYARIRHAMPAIRAKLSADVSRHYRIQSGGRTVEPFKGAHFVMANWRAWVESQGITWPKDETGMAMSLDSDTFELVAKQHPSVRLMADLRKLLGAMRPMALTIGADGYNRFLVSPFRSATFRNQPSNANAIFGCPKWMRPLILAKPGRFVAYLDFVAQETAIAACLSGDEAMWAAYLSGDIYLAFGKSAGLIPPEGTAETYPVERAICKVLVLGVSYGMEAGTMARNAGVHIEIARRLLRLHREAYRTFWAWSNTQVAAAFAGAPLYSPFGMRMWVRGREPRPLSLKNWPMQSSGSDMMRYAAILLTRAGIEVAAPVHDAFLISGPTEQQGKIVETALELMALASERVLGRGRRCRVKAETIAAWPESFAVPPELDGKGRPSMWHLVLKHVNELELDRATELQSFNGPAHATF